MVNDTLTADKTLKSKRGFFYVSDEFMFRFDLMKIVYSEFFPFQIEYERMNDRWKLVGCSERFESINEGDVIPQYYFLMKRNENDEIVFSDCQKI